MENNENKVIEAAVEAVQQDTAAPIVPAQVEEKKGFLGWVKEHKKGILGGLAAVGGGLLCFVLGAATQRSADSIDVEDDRDLYDSDGNYEPQIYELEPETDSNDEDEAV